MSRSYRKYPIVTNEKNDVHYANRALRRKPLMKIANGGAHKHYKSNGWNWKYRWTIKDATELYNIVGPSERFPTLEEYLIWYKKKFVSK